MGGGVTARTVMVMDSAIPQTPISLDKGLSFCRILPSLGLCPTPRLGTQTAPSGRGHQ